MTAAFAPHGAALLGDDLGALLGEQLLPVATRPPDHEGPYLLAVDAAVHPVVIEIIQLLDDAALVTAMEYLRLAEKWTYRDVASVYHAGSDVFERDLDAFRRALPTSALAAAFRNAGPRLILVCTEVAPGVLPALGFLLESEHPVEVLQIGVLTGSDGGAYADVVPITRQVVEQRVRAVDGASAEHPRAAGAVGPGGGHAAERPLVRAGASSGHPPARTGRWSGTERRTAQRPWSGGERRAPALREAIGAPASRAIGGAPAVAAPSGARSAPTPNDDARTPAAGVGLGPGLSTGPLPADAVRAGWSSPGALALAELARAVSTPATLVWERRRRGQRFEAMLLSNGSILLPDGSAHADPDQAATAVCGADSVVDGWRVWRMGPGGPTLAEALGR